MVKIKATNQALLAPLQHVTGIVERRHTLPILSNVLIQAHGGHGRLRRDGPRGPDHREGRHSRATAPKAR